MGSPELPNDAGDNPPLKTPDIQYINHNTSDESDMENDNDYNGYEPLPLVDRGDDGQIEQTEYDDSYEIGQGDPMVSDLPTVLSTDAEIELQVWSQPRPTELEIELDTTRAEQIMTAMASISLPTSAIPDWAQGIPEERWKEALLERIRQRKELSTNNAKQNPIANNNSKV